MNIYHDTKVEIHKDFKVELSQIMSVARRTVARDTHNRGEGNVS